MFYYCESEQGSTCSTPFVSAPSSPSRNSSTNMKNNSLYYYFSAPSSPPRHEETIQSQNQAQTHQQQHQRGFSFTECEFQFHSAANAATGHLLQVGNPSPKRVDHGEEEEMEDADVTGFYFSAPTSPDRNKDRFSKAGIASCSYWDEMPGTPKMIFGGAKNAAAAASSNSSPSGFFNADSDFEFSSSRMSDSDSAVSVQMSSADELFFKGQLLPLKLKTHQLTSSDSSGSSNTMGAASGSSIAGSAPQSPKSGKKGSSAAARDSSPNRMKSAVMGTICGAVLKNSGSISDSAASDSTSGTRIRSLSPLQLLKKYQSMMMMMGRPSSSSSSSSSASFSASSSLSSSSSSSSSSAPRPSRTSSKGRTLRELLHLSSVHKKSKQAPCSSSSSSSSLQQSESSAAAAAAAPASVSASSSISSTSSSASSDSNRIVKPDEPTSSETLSQQQIPVPKSAETASVSKRFTDTSSSSSSNRKRFVERSLVGDYTKKFNKQQQQQQQQNHHQNQQGIRRRFHSGSILDLHYGNPKRFHSSSIVPEADYYSAYSGPLVMNGTAQYPHGYRAAYRAALGLDNKRLNYHVAENRKGTLSQFHSGPIDGGGGNAGAKRFVNAAALANLADHPQGMRRWENGVHYNNLFNAAAVSSNNVGSSSGSGAAVAGSTAGTPSSACSSRNVSPRRSRHSSSASGSGISLHELHYKTQRANAEEMRRKTFLPYKQGLLGCLGCATMRIAGLSKTLQPMTSSAR